MYNRLLASASALAMLCRAIERGQQRQELVALVSGRDGVLLEEPDGEGRCLFADASAQMRCGGECSPGYRALHGHHLACACGRPSRRGKRSTRASQAATRALPPRETQTRN